MIPDWMASQATLFPHKWAISTKDAQVTHNKMKKHNFNLKKLKDGSRKTPEDNLLEFTLFKFEELSALNEPFVINWSARTKHPSASVPAQCSLKEFKLFSKNDLLPIALQSRRRRSSRSIPWEIHNHSEKKCLPDSLPH